MSDANNVVTKQYLTFTLDREVFAIEISRVQEVLEYVPITRVPRTPEHVSGVINLRGIVVPVVDLIRKFGRSTEITVDTCIVIVTVPIDGEPTVLGLVTDSVREVVEMRSDQIEPPPRMGTTLGTRYIEGMGKQDDGFVIILDIEQVFANDDISPLEELSNVHARGSAREAAAAAG